jgi:hypothetical protein
MASQNDIGSKSQRISNPLRALGLIQVASGLFILYLGLQLLLSVSSLVQKGNNPAAWIAMIFGLIIFIKGGLHTFSGMFKCFSLVVGRNDPKSLAHNYANPSENQMHFGYTSADLTEMLNSRQNKTFVEPRCWVEGVYYTMFRKLFFLPPPYRNLIQSALSAVINTTVILLCYGILCFMISSSLIGAGNAEIIKNLCTIILGAKLIFIWRNVFFVDRNKLSPPDNLSFKSLILNLVYAVLVPTVFVVIFSFVTIPESGMFTAAVESFNSFPWQMWFWYFSLIPLALTVPLYIMAWCKSREYQLKTEVSERIVDWQESIHPRDLFIAIDNNAMAKRRFMEVPNRVYAQFKPSLQSNSSQSKGEYSGYTVQETQPVFEKSEQFGIFVVLKYLLGIAAGLTTAYTYNILSSIAGEFARRWGGTIDVGVGTVIMQYAFTLLLLFILCRLLWGMAELFFCELKFKSLLVFYRNSGTYTTSKVSVGASIYDSNRSENTVVRSSFHQWFLASEIVSVTFLGRGLTKFDSTRYVMEMHEDTESIDSIVNDLRQYIDKFNVIADVAQNSNARNTAENISRMNIQNQAQTRMAIDNADKLAVSQSNDGFINLNTGDLDQQQTVNLGGDVID